MPIRPVARDRAWLLPPTLDELVPATHPARYIARFAEGLTAAEWLQMGVATDGAALGAPAYDPRALTEVWLYGFMTGVRSSRKLEAACREQLGYLWLTGWQFPDHNTLWRFYKEHRAGMRTLLKRTVRTAVHCNLVDLALQAVDGTKVVANAARDQTLDEAQLVALLERVPAAIRDLEAQNEAGEATLAIALPPALGKPETLRARVERALARARAEESGHANRTDPDATLMKTRQGTVAAYNAQAMVAKVRRREGEPKPPAAFLITAAEVVTETTDSAQLLPMVDQATAMTGQPAAMTLADAGYHSAPNLAGCAERSRRVAMPEAQQRRLQDRYHKEQFTYQPEADEYCCPEGRPLRFVGLMTNQRHPELPPFRV